MDLVLLMAALAALIAHCLIVSPKKLMWNDEIQTTRLLVDPSWRHMLTAIAAGADTAPPLYHLLARGWIALFGSAPISLRLFSSLGLGAGLVTLWYTLRCIHSRVATALGVFTVFFCGPLVLQQNVEVRYYGLLVLLVALAIHASHALMTRRGLSTRLFVANVAVTAALVLTHIYGSIYSGALFGALLVWDLLHRQWRPKRYLSFVIGWLAFIPYLPALATQRAMAPRSWIPVPGIHDLIDGYLFGITFLQLVVLAAVLLAALVGTPHRRGGSPLIADRDEREHERHAMLSIAVALLAVPLVSFALSKTVVSIFYLRYFIPASMAWAIVLAQLVTSGERASPLLSVSLRDRVRRPVATVAWGAVILGLLAIPPLSGSRRPMDESPWRALAPLAAPGGALNGVPIVVPDLRQYFQIVYYAPSPRMALVYPMDSTVAAEAGSPPFAEIQNNTMALFQHLGYDTAGVHRGDAFLCSTERFAVIDDPQFRWYARRITSDTAFSSIVVGVVANDTVRLVTRHGGTPAACSRAARTART